MSKRQRSGHWVQTLALPVGLVLAGQFVFGVANLLMLAPIWAQMVHLLLANLFWIGLILLGAATFSVEEAVAETSAEQALAEATSEKEVSRAWPGQIPSAS
jgi:heme A synthase